MTNAKSTKRALLASVMAMLLCFTMLLGSTFAWFTDSVTSSGNIIKSGKLEVTMEWAEGDTDPDSASYKDASEGAIFNNTLWEPGYTEAKHIKISNVGTLALKYQMRIIANGVVSELADVIDVYYYDTAKQLTADNYASGEKLGTLSEVLDSTNDKAISQVIAGALLPEGQTAPEDSDNVCVGSKTITIALHMQETADNDYQNLSIGTDFTIQLLATQYTAEEDSFDKNYDKGAAFPWNGSVDDEWYDASETEFVLYTAEEFAGLASLVSEGNNFSGKTVKLGTDIDLANIDWTPIGRMINTSGTDENSTFKGNFDGQSHTIYNLNVDTVDEISDTNKGAGLFGAITGNVSNVNVVNATINTNHWAGVIAGSIEGSITNCSVTNATITCLVDTDKDNGDKAGAIAGYATSGTIENCSVTNATITAYRDLGAIVGASYNLVDQCTVSNVTLIKDNSVDYKGTADDTTVNPYVGTVYGDATVDATGDVTIIEAVSSTVSTADELREALNSDANNINIVLANDIAIDIGTGWNMGGAETESITIKGATPTTVLTLSSGYRSYFNMANPDGTLYLQDMVLTNAHTGTHFFDYTTHFNCDVVATNVAFQKAPLTNAVTAVFNNCTFTEPVASYSLWIMAGSDVTVNGASFNATRGIKIADEDTPDAVTALNVKDAKFNTTQKAAIVVASDMGANITLSNVNIENTIDTVHEVWVDEDYAASDAAVTVTGGRKIYEGNVVSNATELADAVADGKTDLWLLDGEYDVANCKNATLTISGTKNAVIVHKDEGEQGCDYAFESSTVTFKGVTIDTTKNTTGWTWGFARMNANYENCTINGTYFLYGVSKFENCEFNVSGNAYNIWTYGSSEATFTNCTFNCDGKSIYADGNGATGTKLTVTKCTFNDSTNATSGYAKAAIETGTTYGQTYELIISDVEVNGFGVNPDGIVTNSTIWANKHSMTTDKLNVVVDGTDVY